MVREGTVTWLRALVERNGWRIDEEPDLFGDHVAELYDERGNYLLCHCAEAKAGTIRGLARKVQRIREARG